MYTKQTGDQQEDTLMISRGVGGDNSAWRTNATLLAPIDNLLYIIILLSCIGIEDTIVVMSLREMVW